MYYAQVVELVDDVQGCTSVAIGMDAVSDHAWRVESILDCALEEK